jgi:hypothetical protein
MHMVNAAIAEGWSVLPDEAVVARILDGHVGLFEVMRRHNERLYRGSALPPAGPVFASEAGGGITNGARD